MGNSATCIRPRPCKNTLEYSKTLQEAYAHFSSNPALVVNFLSFVKETETWVSPFLDSDATISPAYGLPQGGSLDIHGSNSIYTFKRSGLSGLQARELASLGANEGDIDMLMLAIATPIFFKHFCHDRSVVAVDNSPSEPREKYLAPHKQVSVGQQRSVSITSTGTAITRQSSYGPSSPLHGVVRRTVQNMQTDKAAAMICCKSWTSSLSNYLNDLKLCITIASATATGSRGERFPLVFVNKAFETMTGYDRSEILGSGCGFLQSSVQTEQSQVTRLRTALDEMTPVKVGLTNVRKNGSPFFNLLALAPIVNSKGDVIYILGMQYELEGREEQYPHDLQAIDHLMHVLPQLWQ